MSNPWSILIVDDNPDIVDVLQLGLSLAGFAAHTAVEAAAALDLGRRYSPDFILLDYCINGFRGADDFIRELRRQSPSSEVILASGINNPADKASQLGLKYALQKPFNCDDVLGLLRKINPTPQCTNIPV